MMRKKAKQKLLNGCLAAVVVLSSTLTPMVADAATTNVSNTYTRIGGVDQYATAALMSQTGWTGTTDNVVLSAGMKYALVDALAAGPLAAKLKAPILLTDGGDHLNSFAKAELQRLKPQKVYITSGTAVIKPEVINELKAMGITPVSLGGYDQYETSVNIAKELANQGVDISKVILAAGWLSPADALSVAPIAAAQEMPILTTTQGQLPASVKTYLESIKGKVTDSYVVGGSAVVSEVVKGELPGKVSRYSGLTKYDTNVQILKNFTQEYKTDMVYVVNGETLVDALTGVPLAAASGAPFVLVNQQLEEVTRDFVKLTMSSAKMVALGGEAVVPSAVMNTLMSLVSSPDGPTETPPVQPPTTPTNPKNPTTPSNPTTPTVPSSVTLSNLRVLTDPANSLGTFKNGAEIDLSGLADEVSFLGFALTADQDCTLQFSVFGDLQNISLIAGQEKVVTSGDLIMGGLISGGIDLKDLRLYYKTTKTKTLQGKLLIEGKSVGNLTVKLRFLN